MSIGSLMMGEWIGKWVVDEYHGDKLVCCGVVQEPRRGEWFVILQDAAGEHLHYEAVDTFWDRYRLTRWKR